MNICMMSLGPLPLECTKLLAYGRFTQQGFINACMVHFCNQPDIGTEGTGSRIYLARLHTLYLS